LVPSVRIFALGFAALFVLIGAVFLAWWFVRRPTPEAASVQWVDPGELRLSPIRRERLSDEQMDRLEAIHETFAEVDGMTAEERLDGFLRDLSPDKELEVWEMMAWHYERFVESRSLSHEAKQEAYKVVLMRSMASEEDVLERVPLSALSRDEAIELMRGREDAERL